MKSGASVEADNRATSENRVKFLMRCLRIDDIRNREERKPLDRLAAERGILSVFVKNSQTAFKPSECLTIDEKLVVFRVNQLLRQFVPARSLNTA